MVLPLMLICRLSPSLIGHIHVAKTGGTVLNEMLANEYERVCGHKGYSFDFYQANIRSRGFNYPGEVRDYIHKTFRKGRNKWSRLRVPISIMEERGYEDCDWLSNEISMEWWQKFKNWTDPLVFHLPCRDPIDHFMSQANYRNIKINCSKFDFNNVEKIMVFPNRFQASLSLSIAPVRCIHFEKQFSEYPKLLGLQKKKIVGKLHALKTNKDRKRHDECIWGNITLQQQLRDYLVQNYDYYNFCLTCADWVV